MKKIALVLGVVASVVALSSCANKTTTDQNVATTAPVAHHHDYKGEMNK